MALLTLLAAGCFCDAGTAGSERDGAAESGVAGGDACASPCCGDGVIDPGEECDGANLGVNDFGEPITCQDLGFHDGTLSCSAFCRFIKSDCLEQICGGQVAHDLSGDAVADLVVSAPSSTTTRLLVFAAGLGGSPYETTSAGSAADLFGSTVAHVRDLQGDGSSDLAVGVGWSDSSNSPGGFVHVYLSSGCPLEPLLPPGPDVVLVGGADEIFGVAVADGGDMDGNGHGELLVGAPASTPTGDGRAHVFLGPEVPSGIPAATLSSPGYGRYFGGAVAGGGDVSGDGILDVAVGLYHRVYEGTLQEGQVHLFFGTAGSVPDSSYDGVLWPIAGTGSILDELFGFSIAFLGDFDADGVGDLAVGAPGQPGDGGTVYVHFGPVPSGLTYFTGLAGDRLGYSVEPLGDTNGDGYADFAAGAPGADGGAGAVYVYFGSLAAPAPVTLTVPGTVGLGRALAATDFNGDGTIDLAASSERLGDGGAGRVFVWADVGTATAGAAPAIELAGETPGDGFGTAID